jgi:hypothetical protein
MKNRKVAKPAAYVRFGKDGEEEEKSKEADLLCEMFGKQENAFSFPLLKTCFVLKKTAQL